MLPHCNVLARDRYRNVVTLLAACAFLEGDGIAAAEALNQFTRLHRRHQAPTATDLAPLVYDFVTLEWPGEAPRRRLDGAMAYWAAHMLDHDFQIGRVHGEGPHRVRVTGRLFTRPDGDEPLLSARVAQVWTRENGFDFRVREMRVGAFERTPSD